MSCFKLSKLFKNSNFFRDSKYLFSSSKLTSPKLKSSAITSDNTHGAAKAMLYGIGLTDTTMNYPMIGVCSSSFESNPCNNHLFKLHDELMTEFNLQKNNEINIKNQQKNEELYKLNAFKFHTIGVSDGMSMGTVGMNYSLPSREIIADSIEIQCNGALYDGLITMPGCDKNIPASAMAMFRLDIPSILIYGGTINSGIYCDEKVDIISAFKSYGQLLKNELTDETRNELLKCCIPTSGGACGGMYTANTMALACETLGLTPPNSSSNPANSKEKYNELKSIPKLINNLIQNDITPSKIITKQSFLNAITAILCAQGSTNGILHLLAMANELDNINLTLSDFDTLSDIVPILGNFKPSGKYLMEELYNIGGTNVLLKYLIKHKLIDGKCYTITGNTLEENVKDINISFIEDYINDNNSKEPVIYPINNPIKKDGNLKILYGNLSPDGCVAKISSKEENYFKGEANIFESESDFITALENGNIKEGSVIIIRGMGPKSSPGMPEMLKPTSSIVGYGLEGKVAFLTDGRFSGGSSGFIIGHITPEYYNNNSALGKILNGDIIEINIINKTINVLNIDLNKRKFKQFKRNNELNGYLKKYVNNVSSASKGCITINK